MARDYLTARPPDCLATSLAGCVAVRRAWLRRRLLRFLAVNCQASAKRAARSAHIDLLVDFYIKLSYLSYNYETTWRMSNATQHTAGWHSHTHSRTHTHAHSYTLTHKRSRLAHTHSHTCSCCCAHCTSEFMALRIRRGGRQKKKQKKPNIVAPPPTWHLPLLPAVFHTLRVSFEP